MDMCGGSMYLGAGTLRGQRRVPLLLAFYIEFMLPVCGFFKAFVVLLFKCVHMSVCFQEFRCLQRIAADSPGAGVPGG